MGKTKNVPTSNEEERQLKIDISLELNVRLMRYAESIKGTPASIVRVWIDEKLAEIENRPFPNLGLSSQPGAKKKTV